MLVTQRPEDGVDTDAVAVVSTDGGGTVAAPEVGRLGALETVVPGTHPVTWDRPFVSSHAQRVVNLRAALGVAWQQGASLPTPEAIFLTDLLLLRLDQGRDWQP